jgi:hypothetical protein
MRRRSARYIGAHFAILAMLFSQIALATYACATPQRVAPVPIAQGPVEGDAGQVPCAAMLSPSDTPQANACEVHCTDGLTLADSPICPGDARCPAGAGPPARLARGGEGSCSCLVGTVAGCSATHRPFLPSPDLILAIV